MLESVYDTRTSNVVDCLFSMGSTYHFRINTLKAQPMNLLEDMRESGIDARADERIDGGASLPVIRNDLEPRGTRVEANRFAAEAVMQGAHLYAPGVRHCHGLKPGTNATVVDQSDKVVGVGLARQSETTVLNYRRGVAVEVSENCYGLPSLMDRRWYANGEIHLQSLPAMTTSIVLDPRPGDVIVDMNCAPGGKMSHMCQLTRNDARIVGFDRNSRKIERARHQLERLGCKNYTLINHDSRYAHLDYSLSADRVLVDPPCTGLGVTPKLAVDVTERDVTNLASYQKQFLSAAKSLVKPGGTIVYSVCTITREECEDVAMFGVEECGLKLENATPFLGRSGHDIEGMTQRFDPVADGSGYFIAKFTKP